MGGSDQVLFGVFDGHGTEGRTISGAVADLLPQVVEAALSDAAAASSQTKVGCCPPLIYWEELLTVVPLSIRVYILYCLANLMIFPLSAITHPRSKGWSQEHRRCC